METVIAGIFAWVLGLDAVGIVESFFDRGGDSLSAMRATAEINAALGTELTVSAIVDNPTVRGLSRQLADQVNS